MINATSKPQRKRIILTVIILIVIAFGMYYFRSTPPILFAEGIVQSIFSAPKSALYSLGRQDNQKEVDRLTKANLKLTQVIADYNLLKSENIALKSQFITSGETSQNLVAAKIIGSQGGSQFPTQFVINVGMKDKIQNGMSVVFEKYLVGKITLTSSNYSVVSTTLNSNFKILAKTSDTNANGIIIGKNDFMLLEGVVITDTLNNDSLVTTKGEVNARGIGILPDLVIGKITSVSKSEASPFQSAQISPILNFSKLTNVFVITQM